MEIELMIVNPVLILPSFSDHPTDDESQSHSAAYMAGSFIPSSIVT